METIKVNMTPCDDVQTIHASQNDNEAREWGFELHNNGDVIDASEITDQLVFKAYKGGTEQILPENGSVPTTSPIIADIKYPQGELTDQEFLYRQSPTEEDGLAKIQTIYGNTLKWNQLATFAPRSGTDLGITFEFKADGTIVFNGTATGAYYNNFGNTYNFQGHKLYIKGCPSGGSNLTYYLRDGYNGVASERDFGNGVVVTARANTILQIQILQGVTVTNLTFTPQLFDLTAMGLDTLTDDEVKQWFADYYPLSFYEYNAGSLLSFNGTGIKTANEDESEEHNTTLPISTYFPTGMKSAGNVYDELTESKAITRIGSVDLGTLAWGKGNTASGHWRFTAQLSSVKKTSSSSSIPNLLCAKYSATSPDATWIGTKGITSNDGTPNMLMLCDEDYSDVSSLVASLQGVYLYYELATPTETSFTTASLVTENAEIPLSNEDGTLIGKCTEQLSENPGFIDAKVKLSDSDGECYSNKIQLHIERSPQ